MIEEKVIQPESVAPAEQPVAETDVPQPAAPNLDALKTESVSYTHLTLPTNREV